jgi:hypothetical protein
VEVLEPMVVPLALSARLSRQDARAETLHALLVLAASGQDVSSTAEHVVRYILSSSSAQNPKLLSLAYDILISISSNLFWVETLTSMTKSLASSHQVAVVAMSKIPSLPHPAVAHVALVATSRILDPIVAQNAREGLFPSYLRVNAVHAAAALVLRERPITAPHVDPIRLDPLNPEQIAVVRQSAERALDALVRALADKDDAVVLAALTLLTEYALSTDAVPRSSVLRATKEATAVSVWHLVLPRAERIAARLSPVLTAPRSAQSVSSQPSESQSSTSAPGIIEEARVVSLRLHARRSALRGIARIAAHALSGMSVRQAVDAADVLDPDSASVVAAVTAEANAAAENSVRWAINWTDKVLGPACDDQDWRFASSACSALLVVCSYTSVPAVADKRARWGAKATTRLARILGEHARTMSALLTTALTKEASRSLAALSKDDQVSAKFVSSTAVALLPHAAACPRVSDRLEALSVIASTVVEYDLQGRDTTVGVALHAVTSSVSWRDIFAAALGHDAAQDSRIDDSTTASEVVCCFAQSLLDASQKIITVQETAVRESLMSSWAIMLARLMQQTSACLSWPNSTASSFAKEMFLKMFEALGQYSAFLTRSRGMGMEEYERLQELLVAATIKQNDVNTRAALLACVTKYWIASALKAESNAGHMLKAIWKHAQEHFCDDEVMLGELRTGALWSDARVGNITPAQRATEGGYISLLTALTKKSRAMADQVGSTVTNVLETALFGSIALATSSAEGSTLTTDYAYSSLAPLLALVHRNPSFAENAIQLAKRYTMVMQKAESSDLLVLEAVQNTIAGLQMYLDEFFPKPVSVRRDMAHGHLDMQTLASGVGFGPDHPHAFLINVTQSCVFATSRLDDQAKEAVTVSTEEAVLHAATMARARMRPFHSGTLQNREHGVSNIVEGDQQTLHGAADPFGVVASHIVDTVKALVTLHVSIINRCAFPASHASLSYSAGGALAPLPDSTTKYLLGSLAPGAGSSQRVTLAVRHNQGFAGRVLFSIHVVDSASDRGETHAAQSCIPYYVPSSDVLLLRRPPECAGVDVFRRRWDLMREASSFHVYIRDTQDMDSFVDTLERRSGCLRNVGRMCVSSHVCALVADSSKGDYIALAALAPNARGSTGRGPCLAYVTIRSNSAAYSHAFRNECREWLSPLFKVIILDTDPSLESTVQSLQDRDARFTNDNHGKNPYERWRAAHAARMAYA